MPLKNLSAFSSGPQRVVGDRWILRFCSPRKPVVLLSDRLRFDRRGQSDQSPQVLGYGRHEELVARAAETAKPHSFKTQRGLQMRKQHLDLLSLVTRPRELWRPGKRTRNVASFLMDAAQRISRRHVRTTTRFESA